MAIIYFYYLFDALEFYQTMTSLIPELENGHYRPLYQLAKQTMESKPELWPILGSLFLGPPFDDEDEELSPRKWLVMIQAQYLQPVAEFNWGWPFLKPALSLIGWGEENIQLLLFGKSLCTLLVPHKRYDPREYINRLEGIPWCAGYMGWLDLMTLEQLHQQLIQSREAYFELCEQPEVVRNKIHLKEERPLEWYSQGLANEYANMEEILTAAQKVRKAVAIAVA